MKSKIHWFYGNNSTELTNVVNIKIKNLILTKECKISRIDKLTNDSVEGYFTKNHNILIILNLQPDLRYSVLNFYFDNPIEIFVTSSFNPILVYPELENQLFEVAEVDKS